MPGSCPPSNTSVESLSGDPREKEKAGRGGREGERERENNCGCGCLGRGGVLPCGGPAVPGN